MITHDTRNLDEALADVHAHAEDLRTAALRAQQLVFNSPQGDASAAALTTLAEVESRLLETWGDRASLHVARVGGTGAWSAWITVGAGVIATVAAPSVTGAVEALLWPELFV